MNLKVERYISSYERDGEKLLREYLIELPLDKLKEIIPADSDDPNLYKIYTLDRNQIEKLRGLIPALPTFSLLNEAVYYECFTV